MYHPKLVTHREVWLGELLERVFLHVLMSVIEIEYSLDILLSINCRASTANVSRSEESLLYIYHSSLPGTVPVHFVL